MRHLRESIHKALRIFLSAIFQILPGAEGLCNTPEQSELTNGTAYGAGAELLEQMRSFFNTFFPKAGGGKQPLPALFLSCPYPSVSWMRISDRFCRVCPMLQFNKRKQRHDARIV